MMDMDWEACEVPPQCVLGSGHFQQVSVVAVVHGPQLQGHDS